MKIGYQLGSVFMLCLVINRLTDWLTSSSYDKTASIVAAAVVTFCWFANWLHDRFEERKSTGPLDRSAA